MVDWCINLNFLCFLTWILVQMYQQEPVYQNKGELSRLYNMNKVCYIHENVFKEIP